MNMNKRYLRNDADRWKTSPVAKMFKIYNTDMRLNKGLRFWEAGD